MKKIVKFHLELSFIVHATESKNKVFQAAINLIPSGHIEDVKFTESNLKGEYGNPIILCRMEIRKVELAEEVLRRIGSCLSLEDKDNLLKDFKKRLNKNRFYLRLDKQRAYGQKFEIKSADPLRLRIIFQTSKAEVIKATCQKMGLLP